MYQTNLLTVAEQYTGVKELPGQLHSPLIMAMLQLDNTWPENDETPWCSAFVNWVCFQLGVKRSKDLRARSWLKVGQPLFVNQVDPGMDIVVLQRGGGVQPGAEVIDAPGHVGFVFSITPSLVTVLGGNQSDSVSLATFNTSKVLGYRRLG